MESDMAVPPGLATISEVIWTTSLSWILPVLGLCTMAPLKACQTVVKLLEGLSADRPLSQPTAY